MLALIEYVLDISEEYTIEVSEEDLVFGMELFSVINFFPETIVEATKLAIFTETLLDNKSPRAILQATMNNVRFGIVKDRFNRKGLTDIYHQMDQKVNFSTGKVLIGLSTDSELQTLLGQQIPYLTKHAADIKLCLEGKDCNGINNLLDSLGM